MLTAVGFLFHAQISHLHSSQLPTYAHWMSNGHLKLASPKANCWSPHPQDSASPQSQSHCFSFLTWKSGLLTARNQAGAAVVLASCSCCIQTPQPLCAWVLNCKMKTIILTALTLQGSHELLYFQCLQSQLCNRCLRWPLCNNGWAAAL